MLKNPNKRILVICEGNLDKDFFSIFLRKLSMNLDYGIYIYSTNIHLLGKHLEVKYFKDPFFTDDDIDIIQVLKEFKYDEVLEMKYTDILLIFDYDPQDVRYSKEILCKLQSVFSESTNLGQLYLNYPMIESIIDFDELPDINSKYLVKTVNVGDLKQGKYKNHVKCNSCISSFVDISFESLQYIMHYTFKKMSILTNFDSKKYENLLIKQCEMVDSEKRLYVINTLVFFAYDYNSTKFLDLIDI